MKPAGSQDVWCGARRTDGVKHAGFQDEWCEAKTAYRTSGVNLAGRGVRSMYMLAG